MSRDGAEDGDRVGQDDDEWIEVDVDSEDGRADATATILEGIAEVLRDAPDGYRYDLDLDLDERRPKDIRTDGGLDEGGRLKQTDAPVRPKAVVNPDDIGQPRVVEWGHLSRVRGTVEDDRVVVDRRKFKHRFGYGTHQRGPAVPMFQGRLEDALRVYRALDALFTGGVGEVED